MKNKTIRIFLLILSGIVPLLSYANNPDSLILINQVGYQPGAVKTALIRTNSKKFSIIDVKTGKTVYSNNVTAPAYWKYSGDSVGIADFSSLKNPGRYKICIGTNLCSSEFAIGKDVYRDVAKSSIKAYYYNRCSYEITKEFGGKWARKAGHPDTAVIIHESAASASRPAGTVISSPGGWYDAGDYNKYIVNSGITTYTLLLFYQLYPDYCKNLKTNIPESNNAIPDEVDELLVNLRWMLTMQDPADGGVYHKLTNKNFDAFVMPDKATAPRYVVMKSTAATLDFACVMATAYRIFSKETSPELQSLAKRCLTAANRAYQWAKENPKVYYRQPQDIKTGEYPDDMLNDEFFWASCEMALANNNPSAINPVDVRSQKPVLPSWDNVGMLGLFSLANTTNPQFKELKEIASGKIIAYADTLSEKYQKSAYRISLDFFKWGSNSDVANETLIQMMALKLSGNAKYKASVQSGIDYLLGRNATGYCFVTGAGTHSPLFIHHRPSASDGVAEPVPGFMSGGPTLAARNDCGDLAYPSKFPAKSYLDNVCSYSTNEIAINWNAPLFFVMVAMDAE